MLELEALLGLGEVTEQSLGLGKTLGREIPPLAKDPTSTGNVKHQNTD